MLPFRDARPQVCFRSIAFDYSLLSPPLSHLARCTRVANATTSLATASPRPPHPRNQIIQINGLRLVPPLGNVHLVFHSIIKALHLLCSVHIFQRLIKQRKEDRKIYYTMYVRQYYIRVDSGEDVRKVIGNREEVHAQTVGGSARLVQAVVSH